MTTNHPEKLDEALIRPGRVDHQVAFGSATRIQIKELFERMYTNDLPRTTKVIKAPPPPASPLTPTSPPNLAALTPPATPIKPSASTSANGVAMNGIAKHGDKEKAKEGVLSEEELSQIAEEFSKQVPDDMFSPAEIQGFLLKRKTDPRKALVEVGSWVEGMVEVKRRGTKLVTV